METTVINNNVLSDDDRYYLEENFELEYDMGEADPQAQAVYVVAANITDLDSPIWTRDQVVAWVGSEATARGLHVAVVFEERRDQEAHTDGQGGTIYLPADSDHPPYRPLKKGEYLASTLVHEFAHVVAVAKHGEAKIQSHGPEFVRCYLDILSTVMPTERTEAAMAFLRVQVAPR
jgi:hypothetical protein